MRPIRAASPSRRAVREKAENINPDPQIRIAALIRNQDGR
jgi:hypothetical protein